MEKLTPSESELAAEPAVTTQVVRVLPDVPALDREFHYEVPPSVARLSVGDVVRIPLRGRRVRGWVVGLNEEPPDGVRLASVAKRSGYGPTPELVEFSTWAAWRWAGPRTAFMRAATPARNVTSLITHPTSAQSYPAALEHGQQSSVTSFNPVFDAPLTLLRLGPTAERFSLVEAAAQKGHALILVPSVAQAASLGRQLTRRGYQPAVFPNDWARIRGGAPLVLGSRAAAFAPMARLDAVVVFDEHDELWQEEAAPTWHAREVVIERARRANAPVVLVSPTPSLEALDKSVIKKQSRSAERRSWPKLTIIDRRHEDPKHKSLWSSEVVPYLRGATPVVCVLNRLGRARLLSCKSCGSLATCDQCGSSMEQIEADELRCRQCGEVRPVVCQGCGSSGFKNLRVGLSRAHEELEALIGRKAVEVSAANPLQPPHDHPIYIGTEAVLHQVNRAATVIFLDFDQELLAPRYRASEEALTMLTRAARLVGRSHPVGNLVVQTRLPDHDVLAAVRNADPELWSVPELKRRAALGFPPAKALAEISGAAAASYIDSLVDRHRVEILGPNDGRWLIRAENSMELADYLASQTRVEGRLRIAVDPARI